MSKIQYFLIIGLTKEGGHWDDLFVDNLKQDSNTESVTLIDLPGAGEFDKDSSPITMNSIVKRTRDRYKDSFKTDVRRVLVSISLGGMVGASWTQQYENDFHDFIIMNSSFSNLSPITKRVQPDSIKSFVSIFLTRTRKNKDKKIIDMCSNNKEQHHHTLKKWDELSLKSYMRPLNIIRQVVAGALFKVSKKSPKAKVFVIAAKYDKLAHYSCSETLAATWDAPLHIFEQPHIGHALHIDAPFELAEAIFKYLNEAK